MESKFQTSFIPKRPIAPVGGASGGVGSAPPRPRRSGSLFLTISVGLFILSLALAGGSFAWKKLLLDRQEDYRQQLAKRQEQFDPNLIDELKRMNVKLDTSRQLLANHTALSQVFDLIARVTIERVRFSTLEITGKGSSPADNSIKVTLKGYGSDFSAVAFQSTVLGKLERYGLRGVIKNPIISDPTLDEKGTVSFGLTANIDSENVLYQNLIIPPETTNDETTTGTNNNMTDTTNTSPDPMEQMNQSGNNPR